MPEYPLICNACNRSFDVVCVWADLRAQKCPGCGAADHRQDYRAKSIRTGLDYTTVSGSAGAGGLSITEGFRKHEVPEARRTLPEVGHMIRDDGRVQFKSRADVLRYKAAKTRARRRAEAAAERASSQAAASPPAQASP